uniref:Uncharacterized protein n=1 Tax=Arundo donax TaxID=35708 RepID=A0A0A9CK55_ARUDO
MRMGPGMLMKLKMEPGMLMKLKMDPGILMKLKKIGHPQQRNASQQLYGVSL